MEIARVVFPSWERPVLFVFLQCVKGVQGLRSVSEALRDIRTWECRSWFLRPGYHGVEVRQSMLGTVLNSKDYLVRCAEELARLDVTQIEHLSDDIFAAWEQGRFVFIIGNGGSGSNSSHFSEDLGKSTLRREDFDNDQMKRLKVLSLTDNTPYILAWGNDEGFDRVFSEQLKNLASPGDVLIAISGSGNSPNILRAVEWANKHNLITWGVTGYSGGKLKGLGQKSLHVPLDDMGMVECIHLTAFHWVLNDIHARINKVGRHAPA